MLYELRVTGLLYDNKIEWLLKIKEKLDSVFSVLECPKFEVIELQELDDFSRDIDGTKSAPYWTQLCEHHAKVHAPDKLDKFSTDCECGVEGCMLTSEYYLDIEENQIRSKGKNDEWMIIRTERRI